MSALQAVRYAAEIPHYYPEFRSEVNQLDLGGRSIPVSLADTGSAVFGAAIYDLYVADTETDPAARAESRWVGGLSMRYMNVLDDAIDDPRLGLSAEQKGDLILSSVSSVWRPDALNQQPVPATDYFKQAAAIGSALRAAVIETDTHNRVATTLHEFAEAEAVHGLNVTPDGLIASCIKLGKPCGSIMSSGVEAVTGMDNPVAVLAAESLGAYGTLLDHAFEVNADLRDNSSTVVTAIIARDGDSHRTRKAARDYCLDTANDIRNIGKLDLTPRQRKVYGAIATLFDTRYKLVVRLQDSLIRPAA